VTVRAQQFAAAERGASPPVRRRQPHARATLLVVGVAAHSCSIIIAWAALRQLAPNTFAGSFLRIYILVGLATIAALALQGAYHAQREAPLRSRSYQLSVSLKSLLPTVALALILDSATRGEHAPTFGPIGAFCLALSTLVVLPMFRTTFRSAVVGPRRPRRRPQRILILGSGPVAKRVAGRLERSPGVTVVGLVDDDPAAGEKVLGHLEELPALCALHDVDRVLDAFPNAPSHKTTEAFRRMPRPVAISVVPRLFEMFSWRSTVEELDGMPLLHVASPQHTRLARAAKRIMDIVGAAIGLVALSPLLVGIAIAIKLTSPGPVLFRQLRTGREGHPFTILKFRTMYDDAEARRHEMADRNEMDGPIFKMRHDPRATRIGRLLRRTSLDELPQLVNVLRGDMSLVGPRPFPLDESEKIDGWATTRFRVRPGITGLWQVCGRNQLTYDDLRHLDSIYVASWSLWWDLRILLQTPGCVLGGRGLL
jgi:exopolysaccharide biosynthesis polyprenyl glycosylphosphotransferase